MLAHLLNLLQARQGEIDQHQLCTELGISPAMLQNYLDVLVRTGRISPYQTGETACNQVETCLSSGKPVQAQRSVRSPCLPPVKSLSLLRNLPGSGQTEIRQQTENKIRP